MQLYLQERISGLEATGEFTPVSTAHVQDMYLLLYSLNESTYIGNNAEIKTDDYYQLYITKLLHIMYGTLVFKEKEHEVQVGAILNEANYKVDLIIIYSNPIELISEKKYCSFSLCLSGNFDVKIIDYKSYSELVKKIGNEPVSFKQYILRNVFRSKDMESELDYLSSNETSYFNEKKTDIEDDFITSKGMEMYLEEIKKSYYKIK